MLFIDFPKLPNRPADTKVQEIRNFPTPTTVAQLRSFLGLINYYHRFVPNCARILRPLNSLLRNNPKSIELTESALSAFEAIKNALADTVMLHHQLPDAPISITVDASSTAIGGVLQQHNGSGWKPLSFFSRRLSDTEVKYSVFGRELLAI